MSKGVQDYSQILSRKQILLAFGMLVAKELEKKGLIGREDSTSESVRVQSTTIVLELSTEALDMALEKRAGK